MKWNKMCKLAATGINKEGIYSSNLRDVRPMDQNCRGRLSV